MAYDTMIYVALLRGINVGGKNKVEMPKLKLVFENLGFTNVTTYINSGNVIFCTNSTSIPTLIQKIETAIEQTFSFYVKVILRDLPAMQALAKELPDDWTNDTNAKTDVMFLWPEVDTPKILEQLSIKPDIETVKYVPGTLLWHVNRKHITKSALLKLAGTPLYQQMTIRNINTARRLCEMMSSLATKQLQTTPPKSTAK